MPTIFMHYVTALSTRVGSHMAQAASQQ